MWKKRAAASALAEQEEEGDNSVIGGDFGSGLTHVEDITTFLAQTDKRRKTPSDKALDARVKGWIESLKAGLPQKLAVGTGDSLEDLKQLLDLQAALFSPTSEWFVKEGIVQKLTNNKEVIQMPVDQIRASGDGSRVDVRVCRFFSRLSREILHVFTVHEDQQQQMRGQEASSSSSASAASSSSASASRNAGVESLSRLCEPDDDQSLLSVFHCKAGAHSESHEDRGKTASTRPAISVC
jgi:hypothetical protein